MSKRHFPLAAIRLFAIRKIAEKIFFRRCSDRLAKITAFSSVKAMVVGQNCWVFSALFMATALAVAALAGSFGLAQAQTGPAATSTTPGSTTGAGGTGIGGASGMGGTATGSGANMNSGAGMTSNSSGGTGTGSTMATRRA